MVSFESTVGGRIYQHFSAKVSSVQATDQLWADVVLSLSKICGGGTKHINVLWTTLAREIDLWFDTACCLSILITNDSHFSLFGKIK